MTTRQSRLAKLEAALLNVEDLEEIVIWWADVDAGLWREGVGTPGEEEGRTMPFTPELADEIRQEGGHRLMLTGLPNRGRS